MSGPPVAPKAPSPLGVIGTVSRIFCTAILSLGRRDVAAFEQTVDPRLVSVDGAVGAVGADDHDVPGAGVVVVGGCDDVEEAGVGRAREGCRRS